MKIHLRRSCLIIAVMLTLNVAVNAQTATKHTNVNESFRTQLKKGTLPGLVFAPGTGSLQTKKEENLNTSSSRQDKNQIVLASDKKPEFKKDSTTIVKPVISTQEIPQESPPKKQ